MYGVPANFDFGHLCYLIRVGNGNAVQLVPGGAKRDIVVEKIDDDEDYGVVTDDLNKMKRSMRYLVEVNQGSNEGTHNE